MSHTATDADFNAPSRYLEAQIQIFFDDTPTVVTHEDFLIDFDLLEEAGSDTSYPIGVASANEFSFALLNQGGIFSPTNETSPYFGKIQKGIKVMPYIRPHGADWIPLGIFYVNEWNATITSLNADITCYDTLRRIFNASPMRPPVKTNITSAEAYSLIGEQLNFTPNVDATLDMVLPWWFALNDNKKSLQELTIGSHAACYCDRDGTVKIQNMLLTRPLRAVIDDQTQMVSAAIKQTLTKEFDGLLINLNNHQTTDAKEIMTVKGVLIPPGYSESARIQFSNTPVARIENTRLSSISPFLALQRYIATPFDIMYELNNTSNAEQSSDISVYGSTIETTKSLYRDDGENSMNFDNTYVQTDTLAEVHRLMLSRFVSSALPYLDLEVRGNPLLKIGDKVTVQSTKYSLNFTGYILRQRFTYTGALRAQLHLIDSRILEVLE